MSALIRDAAIDAALGAYSNMNFRRRGNRLAMASALKAATPLLVKRLADDHPEIGQSEIDLLTGVIARSCHDGCEAGDHIVACADPPCPCRRLAREILITLRGDTATRAQGKEARG